MQDRCVCCGEYVPEGMQICNNCETNCNDFIGTLDKVKVHQECKWIYDEYHDYWDTECGEGQIFTADGPKENKYKYCPYCGKEIGVSEDD